MERSSPDLPVPWRMHLPFLTNLKGNFHCNGNLVRAAVEFAKEWRRDRVLQKLEALLIMTDGAHLFLVSGSGEVIEPDDGILAIGSGGNYALAAARALCSVSDLSAREIAERSLHVAADICVYTNHNVIVEEIG